MNGSYISGFTSKDKKPFEELDLMLDSEPDVEAFLNRPENNEYKFTVQKTKSFFAGFYSYFALELLSSIDFIAQKHQTHSITEITHYLANWSDRKKTLFTNPKFIELAVKKLETQFP